MSTSDEEEYEDEDEFDPTYLQSNSIHGLKRGATDDPASGFVAKFSTTTANNK